MNDPRELLDAALEAVGPVDYASVRYMRTRTASLSLHDSSLVSVADTSDDGWGIRVLVKGCWGFAATDSSSRDEIVRAARSAVALARLSAPLVKLRVELADEPIHQGEWRSPLEIDPFSVNDTDRIELISERSRRLLANPLITHVDAHLVMVREEVHYADSRGSRFHQERHRIEAQWEATAVDAHSGDFESMSTTAPPAARGWEYVLGSGQRIGGARPWDWDAELESLPDLLAEKMAAPSVEPGPRTLVIDPTNLWLTIHESVGHATELDRALGYEANYAGTSFATPDLLGTLRYGSDLMHVTGDRNTPYGLATVGWDDEAVAAQQWDLVREGTLVGYQLDRAMAAEFGFPRSNGCAYADSAEHVPIQRMPNVSLQPDPEGPGIEALIAGVDDGIFVVGDRSWSIDMQRYNFQFTGQRFHRIRHGRLDGQVRDVAYQSRTPDFWASLVALGGPDTYLLGGALNCGKGQPGQVAAVSHGCPAAVFERVNILNARQESR